LCAYSVPAAKIGRYWAVLITVLLVVLGFPLLRDWLLTLIGDGKRGWLSSHKISLSAWVDWLRIVFEIALALFVSNQIFNDPLRRWFEKSLDKLRASLTGGS
jgi:hypothetical protein